MRVPPTERRGRVHTSSVSVAVVDDVKADVSINKKDVKITYNRSSGPGGQRRDKTETCVTLYHYPTQIKIVCQKYSYRQKNEERAWELLKERVIKKRKENSDSQNHRQRENQIGIGGRLDKKRTYRVIDDIVIDHKTGKQISIKEWRKGKITKLH